MYAHIIDNEIIEVGTPTFRPIYFDGRSWDCRNPIIRAEYIIAANWVEVVTVPRPADTATETSERTYGLIEGVPTEVWTMRLLTPEELLAIQEAANEAIIGNKIETVDLPAMQAVIDQTNALLRDDPSQEIKDIARAVRRLGRKVQGILDGTE